MSGFDHEIQHLIYCFGEEAPGGLTHFFSTVLVTNSSLWVILVLMYFNKMLEVRF